MVLSEADVQANDFHDDRHIRPRFVVIGANHLTARIEVREALARRATYDRLRRASGTRPPWDDLMLLTTCNRVEVYAICESVEAASHAICDAFRLPRDSPSLYVLEGTAAVAHLLRVATGLESMAQGEGQVTAQVRQAARGRPSAASKDSPLAALFLQAARSASRIRAGTGLTESRASAGWAAVRLIQGVIPVEGPHVVLLGTGKMARLAAAALDGKASLTFLGRDPRKARKAGSSMGGQFGGLRDVGAALVRADVVVAATSRQRPVLTRARVQAALRKRSGRRLWLIDLGFPRNIDPRCSSLEGVTLVDIDGLAPWGWHPLPPEALARAESLIREEASRLLRLVVPGPEAGVARFRKAVETVRRDEVNRALARLSRLSPEEQSVIDKLATRLVNRFLHEPTEWLRTLPDELSSRAAAELVSRLEASIGR